MLGLASSLSPAISTQLITLVCKNKPFSKNRVSASENELSGDHLQLLLSETTPIHANSSLLVSIILPALTSGEESDSVGARSTQFSATSLRFSPILRDLRDFLETAAESVNDAENKVCTFSGWLPTTEDKQSHTEPSAGIYFPMEKWNTYEEN